MLIILTSFTCVLVCLSYSCVLLSWLLSFITKTELRVGRIGFFRISDVSIRIAEMLSINIETLSLTRDKTHPTRFCVLRLDDVRIEAVPKSSCSLQNPTSRNGKQLNIRNIFQRLTRIAQYCGLVINRVHVVVMDIVPNCLLHVTVDELSLETFRSRQGWQFETSCSLIQGKLLQRNSKTGSLLAEISMPFQFSLDINQSIINGLSFRISSPSFSFTDDFLCILKNFLDEQDKTDDVHREAVTDSSPVELLTLNGQLQMSIEITCISIKYTVFGISESRYLIMNLKQMVVSHQDFMINASITNLVIADQFLRSEIRLSSVNLEHFDSTQQNVISSDGLILKFALNDIQWWLNNTSGMAQTLSGQLITMKKQDHQIGSSKSTHVELSNSSCELLDFVNHKSKLMVGYLSCKLNNEATDLEVESLYFGSETAHPVFEVHSWNECIFLGALIIQRQILDSVVNITVGVDDLKIEWSTWISKQVESAVTWLQTLKNEYATKNPRRLELQVSAKRVVLLVDYLESHYAAFCCSKLEISAENSKVRWITKAENIRAVTGSRTGIERISLSDIFKSEPKSFRRESRNTSPARRWSQQKAEENTEQKENDANSTEVKLFFSVDALHITSEEESKVVDRITISTSNQVFMSWSPQLHIILFNALTCLKRTLATSDIKTSTNRKVPRKQMYCLIASNLVDLQLELARNYCILWQGEHLEIERLDSQMRVKSEFLNVVMNERQIISVLNPSIVVRLHDDDMTQSRMAFKLSQKNKVWSWTADKFLFHLPFDFNFAQVFDEFVNIIKWIKLVHSIKPRIPGETPVLPSDVRIEINEVCLELEDDEFENRLKLSAQLKEDEVYESERRERLLEERLFDLKKVAPFLSKEMIESMKRSLIEKNSQIYIERWKMSEISTNPLFLSTWKGWSMRAFADMSLHGAETCIEFMKKFDPLSRVPEQMYSTLWTRAVEFDVDEWTVCFKDYPMNYLDIKDLHFFGTLVAAESISEDDRSIRECLIPLPEPFPSHLIKRNMSPLKFYYDLQCASTEFICTYGPCWEPCLSMISLVWNSISAPSKDPSQPLPFWDKMRFLLHGRLLWSSEKMVTTMLASNDPYNETETLELCWEDFGLDWALGEIRIKSGLRVFLRTASRYDDSQILSLPDVRLKILLGWECAGEAHDHHSVQLCSPNRLPHYSSIEQHDTYRKYRSSCVNVTLNFDVSAGSCTSVDKMPNLLLYSNTFRWIEQFLKSLTTKNRNVRRGKVFGNRILLKPQLSKHFGKLQVSISLPKVLVTYWMSHSSSYGFRVYSDGLQLTASFRQTVQHSTVNREMNVQRRKLYSWRTHHMTCTWWATQVHVYGGESRPPTDGSPSEDTFLLGFGRVQYARETYPGKDVPLHKVTAYDLKMAWTAENRDACLTIADGVHRAHMLRRILSNDAVKTLNVHLEENIDQKPKEDLPKREEKTHRRGYSVTETNPWMLTQLIDEVGTKLIAHCEQSSDVPIDSLIGVQQSTMDDVKLLNWQIDLFNSQLVLKGCERDGFLLVSAAKSQLLQNFHRNVWKQSLLLSKKSWSAKLSGMQYFAPISATGSNKQKFRWLPREVIDDKDTSGFADDFVQKFTATSEAVGGVVQPEFDCGEKIQLQRIVSRCSCQIYFCYFSDELKTDSSEDISVPPQIDQKHQLLNTESVGIDVLTLKHNMLEAMSNSEQYEMVVDIVNNLVLFVDPVKKEMGEKRRRLRFECQLMSMSELRDKIMRYQSDLREIVSLGRYLERQVFYLNQGEHESVEHTEEQLTMEAEETKQRMLTVSERLATYISSYKQLQVNQLKNYDSRNEKKGIEVVRRFEVCFEDCIWKLTESDGQIALAQTQIRNFLYTRTVRDSNCGDHLFEVGSVRIANLLPDSIYKHALHRDETRHSRQPAIRLFVRDMPPVGGISVKEHFELNIAPMVAEITHRLFDKMMRFFFPGRNIHKNENLDTEVDSSTFSFTRKIASSLSIKSNKSVTEKMIMQQKFCQKDDIDRMKERADKVNHFMYIKIPEVSFVVSYKGNKEKNLIDVNQFNFVFPLCEYHEQNWTWLDLALAVKQRCKRVLLQQFMRQKLLRNRISNFTIDPIAQGISEDEKKRIAVGIATPEQKNQKTQK